MFSDLGLDSEFVFWEGIPSDFFTKIRNKTYKITLTDSYNIHSSFEQCVFDIIASHRERSGVVARRERTRDDGTSEN